MPSGTYLHLDDSIEERFQCAPGPSGWRYTSSRADGVRTDLTVDARWRQLRVELTTADWQLRGGLAGPRLLWVRRGRAAGTGDTDVAGDAADAAEHAAAATGFMGESPGFLVAVARSLRLAPGASADVRSVAVAGPALAALQIDQRWRLAEIETYETELRPLPVECFEVTDLATGEITQVHLAGDVVLAAPGVELSGLETPPTPAE